MAGQGFGAGGPRCETITVLEDLLDEVIGRGVSQYVILGAGLDTVRDSIRSRSAVPSF